MKLVLKVLVGFIAAIALMVYFMRDVMWAEANGSAVARNSALQKVASLPREISESSGLVAVYGQDYLLTHNDAGNKPHLYKLNKQGDLIETIKLNLPNVDWEDLAIDSNGNIYIADSGNNNNRRKELAIYKVNLNNPAQVQAIRYIYEDQKEYPPPKKERNFDSEAIFWSDGSLYIISKDRGRGETAKVYHLPDSAGQYKARLVGQHRIKAQITGAAISPDRKMVALLSEEKLHLFSDFTSPAVFYQGKYEEVSLSGTGQTEGIAFEDNSTLLITSEGGNLYRYSL